MLALSKVKLSTFEKKSLFFVFGSIVLFLSLIVVSRAKNGYFEEFNQYVLNVKDGAGMKPGVQVKISGLVAGYVDHVVLSEVGLVEIQLNIFKKYSKFVQKDSVAFIGRQSFVGEKEIHLYNKFESTQLAAGEPIQNVNEFDLLALSTSPQIVGFFTQNQGLFEQTKELMGQLSSIMKEANALFGQISQEKLPVELMKNSNLLVKEVNSVLKEMRVANPHYVKDISLLSAQLNQLSTQATQQMKALQVLIPVFEKIGPEFPRIAMRLIEALDESVVLVKALQKNYFLKDSVQKTRKEEDRKPASEAETHK
jgi:phospholipid/cholesterol/gamma-HCH transport system substrate-binding protein